MGDRLLKLEEVAQACGLAKGTVQRWEKEGRIPKRVAFPGKHPRWLESDILAWMNAMKQEEKAEAMS